MGIEKYHRPRHTITGTVFITDGEITCLYCDDEPMKGVEMILVSKNISSCKRCYTDFANFFEKYKPEPPIEQTKTQEQKTRLIKRKLNN